MQTGDRADTHLQPPFFAFFERALSFIADTISPRIAANGPDNWQTVVFQRTSVIATELLLFVALLRLLSSLYPAKNGSRFILLACLFMHPALIFVDHIHFQYNGLLFGILFSALAAAQEERFRECAVWFAVLLNFKHIFVYIALPFGLYLFRSFCYKNVFQQDHLIQLAAIVVSITSFSFAPFLFSSGISGIHQIVQRLFPFQRGLNHAYWAANFWALYTAADRFLAKAFQRLELPLNEFALQSTSRGLVGDTAFAVLPEIRPDTCFAITVSINIIILSRLWQTPCHFPKFLQAVSLAGYASFLFGWHVHEKAAMLFLFPQSLLAMQDVKHLKLFLCSSASCIFALLPLMIRSDEQLFVTLYGAFWLVLSVRLMSKQLRYSAGHTLNLSIFDLAYLLGFAALLVFTHAVFPQSPKFRSKFEFLPLLLTSVYCAAGTVWSFIRLAIIFWE